MRNLKPEVSSKFVWRMARRQDSGFVLKEDENYFAIKMKHILVTQMETLTGDDYVAISI
jgi:hypothetical protein